MKKFIALALAILMMAAIAVPTFAAEIAEDGEQSSTAEVTFGVTQSYVVTVPATVQVKIATDDVGVAISAKNVVIPGDKVLNVRVSSPESLDFDGALEAHTAKTKAPFEMIADNGSANLAYKISTTPITDLAQTTAIVNNGICFDITSNEAPSDPGVTEYLYFATVGTTQSANYKDVITFTVSIDSVNS